MEKVLGLLGMDLGDSVGAGEDGVGTGLKLMKIKWGQC